MSMADICFIGLCLGAGLVSWSNHDQLLCGVVAGMLVGWFIRGWKKWEELE